MLGAWFGYLVFLAAVLLFYILLLSGWLAGYVLALSLLLPILSLLLSLPGIRGLRVGLHLGAGGQQRASAALGGAGGEIGFACLCAAWLCGSNASTR